MSSIRYRFCTLFALGSILGTATILTADFAAAQNSKELNKQISSIGKRVTALENKIAAPGRATGGGTGAPGASGARGPKGESGARGEKGERGLQGERGLKGERGAAGAAGPAGSAGPAGPAAPTSHIQQIAGDAVLAATGLPLYNVSYPFDAIRFSQGVKRLAARAYVKLTGDGKWQHRIVIREATATDTTAFLENSPIIFDSDVKSDTTFAGSRFYRKEGAIDAHVWLAPASGKHKFPILRAMVGDATNVTTGTSVVMKSCAQGVIDLPLTDNSNNVTPTLGASCPFGSKITYGVPETSKLGITLNNGVRLAADPDTVMKVCTFSGFDGAAVIKSGPYGSCRNNTIVKWTGTSWSVMNSCQFNNGIFDNGLICYKLQL